jgi:iron complex outermembrane receptor protein
MPFRRALGWTIGATAPNGTYPGIATYTKPSAVPYLNLFCDPRTIQCNAPATLQYVTALRYVDDAVTIEEKGAKFDGPLFDLPAGQAKAAVGATYSSVDVLGHRGNNTGTQSLILPPLTEAEPYQVWAGFAQVDIPVFGNGFQFPLMRKLDLGASWRHDQYYGTLVGATSNPKLGFTWELSEDLGATVRGAWGTSFRFANAGEYSVVLSDSVNDFGLPTSSSPIGLQCGANGTPPAGSLAAKLFAAGIADINGRRGCGSQPAGLSQAGGPQFALRQYIDPTTGRLTFREGGIHLAPETSINYSIGFELAPQITFLSGLDLQATWYSVKINGTLTGFNNPTASNLANPNEAFHYIVPSDLGCPVSANSNPASCAPFEAMAAHILTDPGSAPGIGALTSVYWINDGGTVGIGFVHVEGVDWAASYDWDMGNLGAWNTGVVGTYYLHRYEQTVAGSPIIDDFHQDLAPAGGLAQSGVETLPRMNYRARLGWSNGPFSVTGFVNYNSHYFHTQSAPPNVNLQCSVAGGTTPAAANAVGFPCLISN